MTASFITIVAALLPVLATVVLFALFVAIAAFLGVGRRRV